MIEDDEIEYLTEEQLASLTVEPPVVYYVYFTDAGKIDAITNEKRESTVLGFITVDYKRVEQFLTGTENFIDYVVSLADKDTPMIVKKTEDAGVNTNWLINVQAPTTDNTTLNIVWNNFNKSWDFSIQESYKQQISTLNLNAQLLFFITLKQNANFLVRIINIDMKELLAAKQLQIPWISNAERDFSRLFVSTKRFFDSYGISKYE
jgi:hypothetical protein